MQLQHLRLHCCPSTRVPDLVCACGQALLTFQTPPGVRDGLYYKVLFLIYCF